MMTKLQILQPSILPCIQRQILNSSSSFRSKMIPKVPVRFNANSHLPRKKEPNGVRYFSHREHEADRFLPTDGDVIVSDTIVVLFPF
jgi:hypothetical protein